MTATPFGASEVDTGEFMLGDIYVTVVGFESNGSLDENLEDWNDAYRNQVKTKIQEGLQWWEDTLDISFPNNKHDLNYQVDFTHLDTPIGTGYEPISRPSFDFELWTEDFFNHVGFNSGGFSSNSHAFNQAQREAHNTDWAFTIFVVNDQNDPDGSFAPGRFDRAFAFSGGRFFVTPAHRPASTFTHETGHMFWGRDEYRGGGNYADVRGYYNAQNLNAWDNPAFDTQRDREPSIMDRGACEETAGLLCEAYENHTSSDSSFAMIGWLDSDNDGIFDVLDAPLSLEGSGSYDATLDEYNFVGSAVVQTTLNQNSSGPQNDITINHVSQAQYRINAGSWVEAQRYDDFTASLNLTIPLADGEQIEIRTIDDLTGLSSEIFVGSTAAPTSTLMPGINGFVWNDVDRDGDWDSNETPLANHTVRIVDQDGNPRDFQDGIEPDDYPSQTTLLNDVIQEVSLSAIGFGALDDSVISMTPPGSSSNGNRVFGNFCGSFCTEWTQDSRQLRMDFATPVTTVSIDALAKTAGDIGRLEIYDSDNNLLDRYTTEGLAEAGTVETMTLSLATAKIAYAIAGSHAGHTVLLDNLRFGPEASAVTDARGVYRLPYLEPDSYVVQIVVAGDDQPTLPGSGQQTISLSAGQSVGDVNFGVAASGSPWQNPSNFFDVNDDGFVTPADALSIINVLNALGPHTLTDQPTPPFRDVNADGLVTANDVLRVINHINSNVGSEGEAGAAFAPAGSAPASGAEAEGAASRHPQSVGAGNPLDVPTAGHHVKIRLGVQVAEAPRQNARHLGWQFAVAGQVADAGAPLSAATAERSKSSRAAAAHDQVMEAIDQDDSLVDLILDDDLLSQLAAASA